MQLIAIATAALAAAAPAVAAGSAYVHNQCDFDVTLWSVSADTKTLEPKTLPSGTNYSETYQIPSIGGVSLKLSTTSSVAGPITQFEYTLDGFIWYDISNVDCTGTSCPFQPYGMYLEAGDGCPTRSCIGGELICTGAYTSSTDDWNSLSCDSTADIALYLCTSSAPSSSKRAAKEEFGVPAHRRRHHSHHARHPHAPQTPQ